MAKSDSITLSRFAGLRNTVAPERLASGFGGKNDPQTELQDAVNVDIDDAGQIRRRRGATMVAAGNFHSLYSTPTRSFVVKDGSLCRLFPDYTTVVLQTNVGSEPVQYVDVGADVYFSSPDASGRIDADDVVHPWGEQTGPTTWLSPVLNPTESLPAVRGKLLGRPPLATSMAYFNGRIYLAHENLIWATELYLYDYVDKTRNFMQFEAPVTGIAVVTDGFFVGTTEHIYFCSGPFTEMRRMPVLDVGMIAGSVVYVPADLVGGDNQSKNAALFLTKSGLCAGFDSGVCYNLTQSKNLFPDSNKAAAMFRRQDGMNQYVGVTDSGGAPTSAARIGDYVDVEIRRFKGA